MMTFWPHASPTRAWRHPWCTPECPQHVLPALQKRARAEAALEARADHGRLTGLLEQAADALCFRVRAESESRMCQEESEAAYEQDAELHLALISEIRAELQSADFQRASGDCVCRACGLQYWRHPSDPDLEWLKILCDGCAVKL